MFVLDPSEDWAAADLVPFAVFKYLKREAPKKCVGSKSN